MIKSFLLIEEITNTEIDAKYNNGGISRGYVLLDMQLGRFRELV